jgi:hypothetical protein
MWIDGRDGTKPSTDICENQFTGAVAAQVNPPDNLPVMPGPIYANQKCNIPPQSEDMGSYPGSGQPTDTTTTATPPATAVTAAGTAAATNKLRNTSGINPGPPSVVTGDVNSQPSPDATHELLGCAWAKILPNLDVSRYLQNPAPRVAERRRLGGCAPGVGHQQSRSRTRHSTSF